MVYYFDDNCPTYIYYETRDSAINVADVTGSTKARGLPCLKSDPYHCNFAEPIIILADKKEPPTFTTLGQVDEEELVEAYYQEQTAERPLETSEDAEDLSKYVPKAPIQMMPHDTVMFMSSTNESQDVQFQMSERIDDDESR